MAVPYTFASATSSIPLSQLDSNFSTPITLGNTSIQLGNTVTTLNNMTLANVTVSSVASTFPNNYLANSTATLGNSTITLGGTTSSVGNLTLVNATISSGTYSVTDATVSGSLTLSGGTANGVAYLNGSKVLTTGSALTFDGSNLGIGTSSPGSILDVVGSGNPTLTLRGSAGAYTSVLKLQAAGGGGSVINATGASTDTLTFQITDTEQMRLTPTSLYTASGINVGIGTSSPGEKLDVYLNSTGNISAKVGNTSGSVQLLQGNGIAYLYTATNQPIAFSTNNTERARISSDGTFRVKGAGTAGSTDAFQVDGAAPADAARIDSSGNLLVGTTSAPNATQAYIYQPSGAASKEGLRITNEGAWAALSVNSPFASFADAVANFTATRAATSAYSFLSCYANGVAQIRLRGDGVILAQNTSVQSISDVRVKENVRNADDGLNTILCLRPVRFDFKEGFGNNKKNQLGFIAQEVEVVFPDAVDTAGEKDENGDPYKSVGPGALIPVLVKAIQELNAQQAALNAKLEAQAAEIAALKFSN